MSDTQIDKSRPEWPREVHPDHLAADADHAVEPDYPNGEALNCTHCGLAVTSDGKRHGFDA